MVDQAAAEDIRLFLLTISTLSPELKAWLSSATPQATLDNLIGPVEWDLGAGGIPEIRQLVEERLVLMGENYSLLPSDCRGAVAGLLDEVLSCATAKSGRFLTRAGLLDSFERLTTVTVSRSSFRSTSARQAAQKPRDLEHAGADPSLRDDGLPSLPAVSLERPGLVATAAAAARDGFCYLYASTGMGKSTVALMVVAGSRTEPLWVDLRADPANAAKTVRRAAVAVMQPGAARGLAFDDLCFEGDSRPLQDAVARATAATAAVGGYVIAISAGEIPAALRLRLGRFAGSCIAVPPLTEPEIEELLALHGHDAGAARSAWAGLIWAHTSGHPQLVDAMVQRIRDRGFPGITADDLVLRPDEITEVRDQARSLLRMMPLSQRTLLHRLSLDATAFKRATALRLAGLPEAVAEAGDHFDALVGPWIERVGRQRYRVSPLVIGAGRQANGDEWAVNTHAAAADILLRGELDQFDIQRICMHAVIGRNVRALTKVSHALVQHADKLKPASAMLAWFIHLDPAAGKLVLSRPELMIVRLAQFEIAANLGGENAIGAADALDLQTRLDSNASADEQLCRATALGKILHRVDVAVSPKWVVGAVVELSAICALHSQLTDLVSAGPATDPFEAGAPLDLIATLPVFLSGRLRAPASLHELWQALDSQPAGCRAHLLAPYVADPASANFVTNEVWLAEMRSDAPDWEGLLEALREGFDRAISWGSMPVAAAAAATTVRTLNENLRRHREAFSYGRRAVRVVGPDPTLLDALADVCDWTGRPVASGRLRSRVLTGWKPSRFDRIGPALVGRKAAVSAAREGDWPTAGERLSAAALSLPADPSHDIFRAGLFADAGHALARAGDRVGAVSALWATLRLLRGIPNVPGRTQAFRLHKLFGNLVAWLVVGRRVDDGGFGISEQPPAACSNFDVPGDIGDLRATPLELAVTQVVRYAGPLARDFPELGGMLREAQLSRYAVIRVEARSAEMEAAIAAGDTADIVTFAAFHAREMLTIHEHRQTSGPLGFGAPLALEAIPASGAGFLIMRPVLSCLLCQLDHSGTALPPAGWLASREYASLPNEIRAELLQVDELFSMPLAGRWKRFRASRGNNGSFISLACAVALAHDGLAHPSVLLHAHVTIFQGLTSSMLADEAAPAACRIVAEQWRTIAGQQFRLVSPRVSVPDLLAALAVAENGLPRMAAILKAAFFATGTALPGWLGKILSEQAALERSCDQRV